MTAAVLERPQPLVFIVEDKPESLRRRVRLFEGSGCAVIGALSRDDALRELGTTPMVDLLVTDIHMADDDNPDDKSGIDLARTVRSLWGDIPIAGYSAKFAEDDLSDDDRGVFDLSFPKGRQSLDDLTAQVDACVKLAYLHRLRRTAEREQELERLRRDFAVALPDTQVLRSFAPDGDASVSIEEPLRRAGYRLRLVSASHERALREPFAVWLVSSEAGWEAEVYGIPELYGFGANEIDAIDHLVELMVLSAQELASVSLSAELERVASFLSRTLQSGAGAAS